MPMCGMQVLGLNNGDQRSVDARPSDSIALAMRTDAPLFVSRSIARWSPPFFRAMLCNQTDLTLSLADYDLAAELS